MPLSSMRSCFYKKVLLESKQSVMIIKTLIQTFSMRTPAKIPEREAL